MKENGLLRQQRALLVMEWSVGFRPAGSIWVLLLALRGFSLVEIGLAEGVFHVVSLCCELPSGLMADVLGRKRTLLASQCMFLFSAVLMALSETLVGVCGALGVSALGYNLSSGTREAVTYESMLDRGREGEYLAFSSLQNTVYRLSSGAAMLLAGATAALGWRGAYLLDGAVALAGLGAVLMLKEPGGRTGRGPTAFLPALRETAGGALRLLRSDRGAVGVMLANAAVGACATLTGFFLQQRLEQAIPLRALLGPALFALSSGGVLAAWVARRFDRLAYRWAALLAGLGVGVCVLAAVRGPLGALLAAGILALALDDGLQLVSDRRLNDRFPSAQRATLVSVSSMAFSLFMIPLSPLFGWVFA